MIEKHPKSNLEHIRLHTNESDEVVNQSLIEIYERVANLSLDHLAKMWHTFSDDTKLELCALNATGQNIVRFLALMEGKSQELNTNTKETDSNANSKI